MISLAALADLANEYREDLDLPVGPLMIGESSFDVDVMPVVMGTVNLSRDSTYRESVAVSTESAIRKARIQAAQGADVIDIGAESSTARAALVTPADQIRALVPVVEALVADGILVSAETYEPTVARACLEAGARMLNLTGAEHQEAAFTLAAEFDATIVLCYVGGADVREITDVTVNEDPLPGLIQHLGARAKLAREHGVERIVIDPGMGFYYGNLTDPMTRARHQARVILNTFRLRHLGLPICHALPHAFDLFEDQFRSAEAFFAVLASLGGTSVVRTHEVAKVVPVLRSMTSLLP